MLDTQNIKTFCVDFVERKKSNVKLSDKYKTLTF